MNVIPYVGRQYDVLAFHGEGRAPVEQVLFNQSSAGQICTGITMLAQRWLLEFLTKKESMGFHLSDRGTDFMASIQSGLVSTVPEVISAFNFAALEVQRNLRQEEDEDMPDDERLAGVELGTVEIGDGWISLAVTINSLAGESRSVIVPVSVLPSPLQI